MISASNGVMKRLRGGINGCDVETITYSRRGSARKEEPMAAGEAVSLPAVAKECDDCKTKTTPLWRCGPGGPKSLCNACGIKFSKSKNSIEPIAEYSEKGSSDVWEELKRRQKEKQQKLLLILFQQQREEAKIRKQMNTISRSGTAAASALGEAKRRRRRRSKRGSVSGRGDREAEAAALLLLSLSSASASYS